MTAAHIVRRRRGRPALDLAGKRFGRLLILERAPQIDSRSRWRCRCDCGEVVVILGQSLRQGMTKSCGCLRRDTAAAQGRSMRGTTINRPPNDRAARDRNSSATQSRTNRVARAAADIFGTPQDTTHVDRQGARLVRGSRY